MLKHERFKRRALYALTAWAWLGSGHFVWAAAIEYPDSTAMRVWLLLTLAIAGAMTTASLFLVFVTPLEAVYRSGYEAGQQGSGCSSFKPQLTLVPGGRVSHLIHAEN